MRPQNLNKWIMYCSVFLGMLIPSPSQSEAPENELRLPLALEVFLKKPQKQHYEIHIHLTNISQETVTVNVHDLPWTPPTDSTWLSAYKMDADGNPLKTKVWKGAFGSRSVQLLPGESIQDRLPLNPRYPTLLDDIKEFGVNFHWDCPPPTLKFECKSGAPHSITIPKKEQGLPDVYSIDLAACLKLEETIGLIRIHKEHDVLFLLTTETLMSDLKQIETVLLKTDDYVRQCKPKWTNSWAVSFFTEKRFAGFLSEKGNKGHFERGLWQKANIGQYSSQIRTLYRFPWSRKKSETRYLSVYQLRHGNGK